MRAVFSLALLACLALPGWSQAADSKDEGQKRPSGPEVEFLDSTEAYWVNKGFNDTLFYGAGGSMNSARNERDQFRSDQALRKIYKPTRVIEIRVDGKTQQVAAPTLKMDGKAVKTSP